MVQPGTFRLGGAYQRSNPANFEKKYLDLVVVPTTITTAGVIVPSLNLIPQGVTKNQRIGTKCTLVNINIHGQFSLFGEPAATVAQTGNRVRMVLYIDKQANGAAPIVADLIANAPTAASTIDSFRNLDNVERFVILKDKTYTLNQTTPPSDGANSSIVHRELKINKKCSIPLDFSSTTGVLTELRSNNVGMMFIGFNAGTSVAFVSRVKYSDH